MLISPLGVCRILPRPMPLSFGSFCVLRVTWAPDFLFQQKKNVCSCLPLFVSPGLPVTSSWAPCSRLCLVCSPISRSLLRFSRVRSPVSLPCFVFVVLVRALSFCSGSARLRGVQFIFSVLCTSAPWNCSPAVLWFCSNLPNSGRSAPVPGLLLIFRDWILGNPFQ